MGINKRNFSPSLCYVIPTDSNLIRDFVVYIVDNGSTRDYVAIASMDITGLIRNSCSSSGDSLGSDNLEFSDYAHDCVITIKFLQIRFW